MKTITINGKKFDIDCNAFTYVKYKTFFKTGIMKDIQFIQDYTIKQTVVSKQLEDKGISEEEKLIKVSDCMINDTDDFIIKVTQLAWILIYTADKKVENYEDWLKNITNLKIDDDWIVEVAELAVNCFC